MGAESGAFGALMGALAVYAWTRDDSWRNLAPQAPLVLLMWPLLFQLGRPWSGPSPGAARTPPRSSVIAAAFVLGLGTLTQSVLLLALGWAALLRLGLDALGVSTAHPRRARLLALSAMGFPWLATDLAGLAWHLRAGAAHAVAALLRSAGAVAEGAVIRLGGLTVLVDESCSGVGALQVFLLLAAVLMAAPSTVARPTVVWPAAFALALLANVLRVLGLVALALTCGVEATRGPLHAAVGAAALLGPAILLHALAGARGTRCMRASS